MNSKGFKTDEGKIRVDLIPDTTITGLGKVLSWGLNKYPDRNWERGMNWSRVMGALERHFNAIRAREDYDPESGLLHSEHLLANAAFLNHFYVTNPEGDDRPYPSIKHRKLGLDLDGVVANFLKAFKKAYPDEVDVKHWVQESSVEAHMGTLSDDFWLSLEPLITSEDIPVEPTCYITKRETCRPEIVKEWLKIHNLPLAPVYFSGNGITKSTIAKEVGIDIFVDDKYSNFLELNTNGVVCFLMNQPHNTSFDVGYKRIHMLNDLKTRFRLF